MRELGVLVKASAGAILALTILLNASSEMVFSQEVPRSQANSGRTKSTDTQSAQEVNPSEEDVSQNLPSTTSVGQTAEYQQAMAKAVRLATARCLDSVVSIEVIGAVGSGEGEVERDAPSSGVIVGEDGYILTSSLVTTRPSASLIVVLGDGERYAATVIAEDEHRDLVLLKIDAREKLKAIDLSQASPLDVGQTVIAVGRYGETQAPLVSRGILSAKQRLDGIALQCDARVSPSFYGGPLIDLYGRPIGVLIPAVAEGGAESSTSWYDSGIAFAIPLNVIARKLDRLKRGEEIKKGLIGIVARSSDPYADDTEIAAVRRRSPAEEAGLQASDTILQIAERTVRRQLDIRQALGAYDAGETISIKFRRGEEIQQIQVTLAESIPPLEPQRLGLLVTDQEKEMVGNEAQTDTTEITDSSRTDDESLAKGETQRSKQVATLVDSTVPGTPADGVFQRGDEILEINGVMPQGVNSLRRLLISMSPDTSVNLVVLREGKKVKLETSPQTITDAAWTRYPEAWESAVEEGSAEASGWRIQDWKLPEAGNAAAVAAPRKDSGIPRLGLLLLLMNPGSGAPSQVLEGWLKTAESCGVVVCAIAAEDQQRWLPKEVDVIGRFATSLVKQFAVQPEAVAIGTLGALAGGDGDAADAMALAVALSRRQLFHGAAVSIKTRPPRIRLPENQGEGSFQLMLSLAEGEAMPDWIPPLKKAGYPVVTGAEVDQSKLLRWVRLLQSL